MEGKCDKKRKESKLIGRFDTRDKWTRLNTESITGCKYYRVAMGQFMPIYSFQLSGKLYVKTVTCFIPTINSTLISS